MYKMTIKRKVIIFKVAWGFMQSRAHLVSQDVQTLENIWSTLD